MDENMEKIYDQLNEQNKDIINMMAKAVQIGQQNANSEDNKKVIKI